MLARLERPYIRGNVTGMEPIMEAPALLRGSRMGRWHRARCGYRLGPGSGSYEWSGRVRDVIHLWCGQTVNLADAIGAGRVPNDEPLCGTCEGRAVGAGHPPIGVTPEERLLFEPASQTRFRRPAVCPAVKLRLVPDPRAMACVCPACGEMVPIRSRVCDYGSSSSCGLGRHAPGEGLVEPCVFHAWDELVLVDGRAVCGCAVGTDTERAC